MRGLSRLLRRNPTDAERALWDALTKDRRFAGMFKRQTPVGPHINDFVSFRERLVIDVVPQAESEAAATARAERHGYLQQRGYRVVRIAEAEVARDVAGVLDRLAAVATQALVVPAKAGTHDHRRGDGRASSNPGRASHVGMAPRR